MPRPLHDQRQRHPRSHQVRDDAHARKFLSGMSRINYAK
jgi:hypothetical protein